ncbi:MAG: hypothetical protein PUI78_03265 [Treponema sp.]|nr:hypothetical protein [Treponema sp.]
MKKLTKLMAALAALMALTFVGCKNDDSGSSVVATYKQTKTEQNVTVTTSITFYSDNTFNITMEGNDGTTNATITLMTGTYKGEPSKDGTITISAEKMISYDNQLEELSPEVKEEIDGDYEITDGKINIPWGTFTRQ